MTITLTKHLLLPILGPYINKKNQKEKRKYKKKIEFFLKENRKVYK
jgi:hypothetical protein